MVQHGGGEDEIEPAVVKGEAGGVGALGAGPVPKRCERLPGRGDHGGIVVSDDHLQAGKGGQKLSCHGSASGTDFQAFPRGRRGH